MGNEIPNNAVDAFNSFLDAFVKGNSYVNKETIVINDIDSFFKKYCDKSQKQEKDKKGNVKTKDNNFDDVVKSLSLKNAPDFDLLNHAVWLWALPNSRKTSWVLPKGENNKINENFKERYEDALLKIKGVAGGGSGYVQTKTNGVRFILYLFTRIKEQNISTVEEAKEAIEGICKQEKYDIDKYPVPDGVKNLLLHLCDNNQYLPIASSNDKNIIVNEFKGLVKISDKKCVDKDLKTIEEAIKNEINITNHNTNINYKFTSFYRHPWSLLWKGESLTSLSLLQKFEYKKAMILYGPPGTGKTYTAMELAEQIIINQFKKNNSNDISKLVSFVKDKSNFAPYISYLQLHVNYNYEDFIAGQTIKKGNVMTKKGFIFDVIDKADDNPNMPQVVILDEINRTDISRVFGELFTAIEKRNTDVTLLDPKRGNGRLILNMPDNIYFIGTMNEIDFSLERVDFALRRRFIWELHDYSEDILEVIINQRRDKDIENKSREDTFFKEIELDSFISSCTNLNKAIKDIMGETYHIGHAFFGEIIDIFIKIKESNINIKYPWEKAKEILWEISIKPTLEAYCGTMDKKEKMDFLKAKEGKFYKAYFGNDYTPLDEQDGES